VPSFTYAGHSPGLYPTLRDAYGVLAGLVEPGDVLEFDQAPDPDWVPYQGGDAEQAMQAAEQAQAAATLTDGGTDGPDPADEPAGSDQDHDTAGNAASEES
jgi:hypothetical protein